MHKGAPPENFRKAELLRQNATKAENVLWEKLRNKLFNNLKFRRQHPIQNYIADFYCHELQLIIEIDGKYHEEEEQKKRDAQRTELLEYQGVRLIRFSNEQVLNQIDEVLAEIEKEVRNQ